MVNGQPPDNIMGNQNAILMKSRRRVQKHGEVFTPQWVVEKMISIPGIREKTEDVFATFLEPSAGEGAFLLAIEDMKLRYITDNYGKDTWRRYALWVLSSIYGIELLEDNLAAARQNMLDLFLNYYETVYNDTHLPEGSDLYKSARTIIWANVVQGNTLTRRNLQGEEITFSHWKQIPHTLFKVERIPFTYSSLLTDDKNEGTGKQISLFEAMETEEQLGMFSIIDSYKEKPLKRQKYTTLDIEQVWREEKENVR